MLRSVVMIAALLLGAGAVHADDFSCRALGGAEPVLTFTIAHAGNTYSVPDVTLKAGEASYSTTATDPAYLVTVAGLDLDNKVQFTLRHDDADFAVVNLVTRFEGGGDIATGTVKGAQGSLQVLRCDIAREG